MTFSKRATAWCSLPWQSEPALIIEHKVSAVINLSHPQYSGHFVSVGQATVVFVVAASSFGQSQCVLAKQAYNSYQGVGECGLIIESLYYTY